MERYKKNWGTFITEEQQQELLKKHILVIGCGGNAEYILEYLARLGVRKITFFDGDCWETSNLNRQTFCTEKTIGKLKVEGTLWRLKEINSSIEYQIYTEFFTEQFIPKVLADKPDLFIFASDANVNIRELRIATATLIKAGIPAIDQGIHEDGCAVGITTCDDLSLWYHSSDEWIDSGKCHKSVSQPAYLCGLVASLTIAEMVRFFFDREHAIVTQRIIYDIWEGRIHLWDEKTLRYLY